VFRDVETRDIQELTLGMTLSHTPFSWWEYQFQFGLYNRQEDIASPGVAPGQRSPAGIPPNTADNTFWRYELTLRHLFPVIKGGSSTGRSALKMARVLAAWRYSQPIFSHAAYLGAVLRSAISVPGLLLQGGVRVIQSTSTPKELARGCLLHL
jgi:hypothetical protein